MVVWVLPAAGGLLGLLIGSFLNVVVWRVPRRESLLHDSHCPKCDTPIRPWQNVPVLSWLMLRGRCARCRAPISVRYPLVEAGTGAAFALVVWWAGHTWGWESFAGGAGAVRAWAAWLALAAYLWFAAISIALTLIDLEHQRLPDAIVLPSLGVILVLLAASSVVSAQWGQLVATFGASAALFGLYFLIVLVYPEGMGGGDVKLAPLVGAMLGFFGWGAVAVGAFAGFLIGAVVGLLLIAAKKAGRKTGLPFGPSMLVGAWVGIIWGEAMWGGYLRLVGFA